MRIEVNGETRDTPAETLAGLFAEAIEALAEAPASRRGFAMALNGAVVRGAAWDATRLAEGDRVEIIRAVAGG